VCGKASLGKHYYPPKTCSPVCAAELRRRSRNPRTGPDHPRWKGGMIKGGYRRIRTPTHPNADVKGYVAEHRLVMEAHIGRYLDREEHVHHRDGDKLNNQIKNLEIVTHVRPHGEVICPHCRKAFRVH
jgi:hypothetical protein